MNCPTHEYEVQQKIKINSLDSTTKYARRCSAKKTLTLITNGLENTPEQINLQKSLPMCIRNQEPNHNWCRAYNQACGRRSSCSTSVCRWLQEAGWREFHRNTEETWCACTCRLNSGLVALELPISTSGTRSLCVFLWWKVEFLVSDNIYWSTED